VEIFWTPADVTMSSNETRQLVDITDGDTPNIRMPFACCPRTPPR
jgi:hypothetical protein